MMKTINLTGLIVGLMIFGMLGVSIASPILIDPIGDAVISGLDISSIDYTYTDTTYTQTVYFSSPIDTSIEFALDTSFTIYDEINNYSMESFAFYYNAGDGTGYGSASGFNTQYGTTIFTIGADFISAEFIRSEIYSYTWDSWNVDVDSYQPIGAAVLVNNEGNWSVSDTIQNASVPVPEPTTMILFGTGIAALAGTRLRRKK